MEIERIKLSDPDQWVTVKKRWSWADMKALNAARPESGKDLDAHSAGDVDAAMAFAEKLLERLIAGWSFKEEITPENIGELLDPDEVMKIAARCVELGGPKAEARKGRRPNSSTV